MPETSKATTNIAASAPQTVAVSAKVSAKKTTPKIKSWYANRYQMVVVQRNILLLFTLVSMFAVAIAVVFVKNIMSSKSLEPYVIEVEQKTGVPTIVELMTANHFTGDQMIRKYFINQFVRSASAYDPKTYKTDAEKVRLFSTPNIYTDFRNRVNAKDLGPNSSIEVRIKSVQFPESNVAQIRLARQVNREGFDPQMKDEVIRMGFYFANLDLNLEERLINPLGFQVNEYLIADEVFNY
ncbi:MAG: type IV secretion system protein [Rickettsiales bacterium]|nr:type IV secretion system protein [Rickettsiales bacterium]